MIVNGPKSQKAGSPNPGSLGKSAPQINLGILMPKLKHRFSVEFSFDDVNNILARQVVKVTPHVGDNVLLVTFEDDEKNDVVDLIKKHRDEGMRCEIKVKMLTNMGTPASIWTYVADLVDFHYESLDYASGEPVRIETLFTILYWDVTH